MCTFADVEAAVASYVLVREFTDTGRMETPPRSGEGNPFI